MAKNDPWPKMGGTRFAWVRHHAREFRESLTFVSHRLATSFLVWALIGIALALPAGLFLVQQALNSVGEGWEGRPGFSLYFKVGAPLPAAEAVADELRSDARVQDVWIVSPEEALQQFQGRGGIERALEELDSNPLPASVRVTVVEKVTLDELTELAESTARNPNIDDVAIEKTWLERLAALSSAIRRLGWILAAMFGLAAILVTSASVRLAIESRLEELKVLILVGGTPAFIRRPFLYFGLVYGLGGGVVAAMLLAILLLIMEGPLDTLFGSYGGELALEGFNAIFLCWLLLIGAVLGVSGSILAINQRVRSLEVD